MISLVIHSRSKCVIKPGKGMYNMDGKWEETKALIRAIVNRKFASVEKEVKGQTVVVRKMHEKLESWQLREDTKRPRASIAVTQSSKETEESDKATASTADFSTSPRLPLCSSDSLLPPLSSLDAEILSLESLHSPSELQQSRPFHLSISLRSALSMLSTGWSSPCPIAYQPTAVGLYRLFYRLQGRTVSTINSEVWQECETFLAPDSSLESRLLSSISHFDFSSENLSGFPALQSDVPAGYQVWKPAAVLHRVVLEAAAYAGLVPDKEPVWRRYQRLVRLREESRNR